MQKNNQLNYQVVMKRKIVGQGKIDDIKKPYLNKKFELISDQDLFFEVDLKFISPSIITKIQLKLIRTLQFSLRLMNSQNHLVQQFSQLVSNKDGRITLKPSVVEPITLARLRIQNDPFNMQRIGINFVIFQGFSDESPQNNKKSGNKNNLLSNNKNQETKLPSNLKKDSKNIDSKDFFKERQIKKSVKDDVQRLLGLSNFAQSVKDEMQSFKKKAEQYKAQEKIKKKVKHNESVQKCAKRSTKTQIDLKLQEKQDTDLALALSKSENHQMQLENEYEKMQIQALQHNQKNMPTQLQNYVDNILQMPDRRYQTVEFNQEYVSLFSDLNPKWLQAQRLAQIQAGVREQERLSDYIKIKYLVGVQVYISEFPEWKMQELKHQAKQLGCRVIQQLKNHCLAIVPRSACQKLTKKHKSWNEIKYIIPQYLQECIKQKSKLSPKDYYLRI